MTTFLDRAKMHLTTPNVLALAGAVVIVVSSIVVHASIVAPNTAALDDARAEYESVVAEVERAEAAERAEQEALEQAERDAAAEAERLEREAEAEERAEEERRQQEEAAAQLAASTWKYANDSGFSYDLRFTLERPTRGATARSHPLASDFTAENVCSVSESDLVIPGSLTAVATTEGYDTPISVNFTLNSGGLEYSGTGIPPTRYDDRVRVAQMFSDGGKCSTLSSTNAWGYAQPPAIGVSWQEPLSTGTSVRHAFFIIIQNYYLPAHPDGDPALLDYIAINPLFGGSNTDAAMMYRDVDGANLGIYSNRRMTMNGEITPPR
ncbi:MAG: hypothetical protein KJ659_11215 [Actinobacteria bacterium]|nr:hypothetical protein [Actinomycetota bacterium]MBU1607918.1 hypothetical protein [Actinomycetota bacterium]MBU2316094.1 hypothetical protein [Actinomycetota bacterium]MBU2386043.1 hypothetical protein [Actinomycetota bacterium]